MNEPIGQAVERVFDGHMWGCVLMLRLLKRLMHIKNRTPIEVEVLFSKPDTVSKMLAKLIEDATGKPQYLMTVRTEEGVKLSPCLTSEKGEIWKACKFLTRAIDANGEASTTWYPDGWREAYELAARGRTATAAE